MNNDLIQTVQAKVDAGLPARSVTLTWQGQRYWIKTALKTKTKIWHHLQNIAANLLFCPVLRATFTSAGETGLQEEVRRLNHLAEKGVLVPSVVAQQPGWILLDDIGTSLFEVIEQSEHKEDYLFQAAHFLSLLHKNGHWHGTGQLRDMIYLDGKIGYIDFEENVGEAMDKPSAQARDLLLFLTSSVRFSQKDDHLISRLLATYKENAPPHVWPSIHGVIRRFSPFAMLLLPFEKKLGRDLRQALQIYKALKTIDLQR